VWLSGIAASVVLLVVGALPFWLSFADGGIIRDELSRKRDHDLRGYCRSFGPWRKGGNFLYRGA